jgi:hypothetical protein
MGVLFQGFAHAMYGCRIVGNRGPQVEVSRGAAVSLGNCLIVGSGPQAGERALGLEYGRVDHCTILNSSVGITVSVGGSVQNSIIGNCTTVLNVDKNALARFTVDKTILGLGEAVFGDRRVNAANWAEFVTTFKGAAGAIIDNPVLTAPRYLLPDDSQHAKAGDHGSSPGARLPPFREWLAEE